MTRITQPHVHAKIAQEGFPCRSCDRPMELAQSYCLECGAASAAAAPLPEPVATPPVAVASVQREPALSAVPSRGPEPRRLYGFAGAGALACLLGGILLGAAVAGEEERPAPIRVNVPAAKAPIVNVQSAPAAAVPVEEEPFASDWPDRSGWTVQLQVLDKASTQPSAIEAAKSTATSGGASGVGALDSDEHDGLPAGKYIVYAKRYKSRAEASAAARRLRSDFPEAKAIRVKVAGTEVPAGKVDRTAPKPVKQSKKQLQDLQKSTGEEQQEKSEELPDVVITP